MNGAFDFNTGTFNSRRISTRPLRPMRSSRLRRNNISPHDRRLSSLDDTFNSYFNFLRNQQDCLYHIVSQLGTMSMHAHNNMYDVYYRLLLAHVGENNESVNNNTESNAESNTNTPQQIRYTNRALRSLRPESVNRPSNSNNPIRLVNPFANTMLNTGLTGNNIGRLRPTTIRSFWTSPINFNLDHQNITLTPQEINEGTTSVTLEEARRVNQTICPISHEDFTNETEIIKINHCGHMFKKQCLMRWFETHTTCPTCRYNLIQSENTINVSTNTSTASTQTNTPTVNNETTNAGQTTTQTDQSGQNNSFTNLFSDDFINTISNTLADSITQSINSFGADLSNNSLRADISMFMPLYNEAASNLNRNQGGNTSTTEGENEEKTEERQEEKTEETRNSDISNNHQQTENSDDDILNEAFNDVNNNLDVHSI